MHLKLSAGGQMDRIANADRAAFGKLRDTGLRAKLQADFKACERAMPAADLAIDTALVSADEAATIIVARLA